MYFVQFLSFKTSTKILSTAMVTTLQNTDNKISNTKFTSEESATFYST
jgi:hypothetical protein